jgi:hypothetical protein
MEYEHHQFEQQYNHQQQPSAVQHDNTVHHQPIMLLNPYNNVSRQIQTTTTTTENHTFNIDNNNNNYIGIMDHHLNVPTESIMKNYDTKQMNTTRRIEKTKSIPIPVQQHDSNSRINDNYFDDSSDDEDNNILCTDQLGQEVEQQHQNQNSTTLDYSVTSISSSSSISNNIRVQQENHHQRHHVAKSLPSRTALLRAPYLGSRKSSNQSVLSDDDDDYDYDNGQNIYFDRPVSSNYTRKLLVLPPPQQSFDTDNSIINNNNNNNTNASYLMTGSLMNQSLSSAVPAYGSLRESHLDGRFISKLSTTTTNNDPTNSSTPTSNLASSAPVQLSIGERMHQSRLRRQQQQEQSLVGESIVDGNCRNDNQLPTTQLRSTSGRIKTRSFLGEVLLQGDNPSVVEEDETITSPSASSTPQILNNNNQKSNGIGQLLLSSSPLALDITKSQEYNNNNSTNDQHMPSSIQHHADMNALTYSMNASTLNVDEKEGTIYNDHHKTIVQEESMLSKSLTGFDILRQLGEQQQQQKQGNVHTMSSSYVPTTTRSNMMGMSSAMFTGTSLLPPNNTAATSTAGSSMQQYQYNKKIFEQQQQFNHNGMVNSLIYNNQQYVQTQPTTTTDDDNTDTMGAFDLDM